MRAGREMNGAAVRMTARVPCDGSAATTMSVRDNVLAGLRLAGADENFRPTLDEALDEVGSGFA